MASAVSVPCIVLGSLAIYGMSGHSRHAVARPPPAAIAERARAPVPTTGLDNPDITIVEVLAIVKREMDAAPQGYVKAFDARMEADRDRVPAEPSQADVARLALSMASHWRAVRAMPVDPVSAEVLLRSAEFFQGDIFDLYDQCDSCAGKMRADGFNVGTEQLMATALLVFQKSGFKPMEALRPSDFCGVYHYLRKEEHMTHAEAMDEFIKRLKSYGRLAVASEVTAEPSQANRQGKDARRAEREKSRVGVEPGARGRGRSGSAAGVDDLPRAPRTTAVSRRQAAEAQAALAAEAAAAKKYKKNHRADLVAKNHPGVTGTPKQVAANPAKPKATVLIEVGGAPLTQRDIDRGQSGPTAPPRR